VIQKIDSLATTQESKPKTLEQQIKLQSKNYALKSQITKNDLKSHKMGLYPITDLKLTN
jgi:L-lactate utilization protein LutC